MRTILLDGESKVGKTSVTHAIAEELSPHMRLKTADAGAFFRRITAATIDAAGIVDMRALERMALGEAVDKVLDKDTPFDDEYPWGDLGRSPVEDLVSVVGQLPSSQAAAEQWFVSTVTHAEDANAAECPQPPRSFKGQQHRACDGVVYCM